MYESGLVLEGGGCRAIYTSGVLDAFMENSIDFSYIIGVSAGSCNAVSYIGKCHRRQHDITMNYVRDKRYMSIQSIFKNGEYLNGSWIFGELSYDIQPLDQETYDRSNTVLCVAATNALTGKTEYFYPADFHERGCPVLRASCALPVAAKPVILDGNLYYDGGLNDSIPLKKALDDGCQKVLVILTQDANYVKNPVSGGNAVRRILKKYPKTAELILNRHNMYNNQLRYVEKMEKNGNVYVIRPARPLNCRTLERDTVKLEAIYQLGYRQGLEHVIKVKEFLDIE